jgi:hypothetical protein
VLRGTGFTPGGMVQLHLWGAVDDEGDPAVCAQESVYPLRADAGGEFVLTAAEVGDAYLGTQCRSGWLAWAEDWASGLNSNQVDWIVSWFPVHRRR